jgi:hypothetical protein
VDSSDLLSHHVVLDPVDPAAGGFYHQLREHIRINTAIKKHVQAAQAQAVCKRAQQRAWMKMENTTTMAMVCPNEFSDLPSTMQKAAPIDMQIHSHQMRPRMPKYLANRSDTMPPAAMSFMKT